MCLACHQNDKVAMEFVDRDNVYEVDMEVGTSEASGGIRTAVPTVSPAPQVSPLVGDAGEDLRGDLDPGKEGEGCTRKQLAREELLFHLGHQQGQRVMKSRHTKLRDMQTTRLGAEHALRVAVVQTRMLEQLVAHMHCPQSDG